ncbi:tryparedoxin-like [Haliotis rubra]|uniref:tryparedoxin-like n=1 Tax=Haliotis rubra TaxID=36100 RepID=UPI001EE50E60|nr:tryparedoxin-like [Haliotis rubra]
MNSVVELLGDSLVDGNGQKVDPVSLTKERTVVGLYFGAQWCPPCRQFTKQLLAFFNHMASSKQDVALQLVYLSSDEEKEDFDEYFSTMPWLAVDFEHREVEARVSKHFNIVGLPTLILIDGATGDIITERGTSLIREDPEGERFPWRNDSE